MLCPLCQSPTRIVKSDPIAEGGMAEHTRACTDPKGHDPVYFRTVEILSGALRDLGSLRLAVALQTSVRGERARATTSWRRRRVKELHQAGWSTVRIAGEINVTPSRVRQYLAEIDTAAAA